ncbi:MAG: SIR2 family protein [Hyphomicrobiales bacterium]|nr:MAG: SIR2 family protein [Hyphomicrobiales bacterium]
MATYDPRMLLEGLRSHLTQPEANVAFLLGAGASSSVRVEIQDVEIDAKDKPTTRPLIPNVGELTAICMKEVRRLDPEGEPQRFSKALEEFELEVRPANRPSNIEDILSCIRRKVEAIGGHDTLGGLGLAELKKMDEVIRSTIAQQVNPDSSDFPPKLPHEDLVRWISRMPRRNAVEIFTTNYDVLIETALEAERVASFDGFVGCNRPYFSHESLTRPESMPGAMWTRLWKIHGSINWKTETVRGRPRIIRGSPTTDGEMILPSHHKYDESRKQPYIAFMDRLAKVLDRDDAILIVCGSSFSDEHINTIIFDGLEAKRRPHVVALQYDDVEDDSILGMRAKRHLNLMVVCPTCVYLGGRRMSWKLSELRDPDQYQNEFIVSAKDGENADGTGRLLLGDFAAFTKFLATLVGRQ